MLGFTCGKGGLNFEMDRANDKGSSFLSRLWTQDQIVCIFPERKVSSTSFFLPWKPGTQAVYS